VIPVDRTEVGPAELDSIARALEHGGTATSRSVAELEDRWAVRVGTRHAIVVANGTIARMCIFAGLGLGPADEVITVSRTVNATVAAILYTGATPVFVDIEPDTGLMDAARIEAAITPRTRAICPAHVDGLVADMDMVTAIADRHGLAVVEDAGAAAGATFRGRGAGSWGHAVFDLRGVVDVGLVTTGDDRIADWIRRFRDGGRRGAIHEILGFDFRLPAIAGAIALAGLERIDPAIAARRSIAARYHAALGGLSVGLPIVPVGRSHVFDRYPIRVGAGRDDLVAALAEMGVEAGVDRRLPIHRQPYILERGIHADLPLTDAAAEGWLDLPIYPGLRPDEEAHVVRALRSALAREDREMVTAPVGEPGRSVSAAP
jgi:perosamine synthetase